MLEDYSIDNPLKPVLKYNAFVTPWFEIEAKYYDLEYLNGDPYYSLKSLDGVAVLAFTDDNKIITISQFRPALGFVTRELPAGGINVSETPLEAAKRELLEETAYVSDQWSSLGRGWSGIQAMCMVLLQKTPFKWTNIKLPGKSTALSRFVLMLLNLWLPKVNLFRWGY